AGFTQALQGRRARSKSRLRMRALSQELQRPEDWRPARGIRGRGGRAHAVGLFVFAGYIRAMTKDFPRASRIADQIQRDLSELIRLQLKDPRVSLVTVSSVEVSRDLSHAKVYVTSLASGHSAEEITAALQHAAGFLRSHLARRLKLRSVPQLEFV